jgi:hypothetical protein
MSNASLPARIRPVGEHVPEVGSGSPIVVSSQSMIAARRGTSRRSMTLAKL